MERSSGRAEMQKGGKKEEEKYTYKSTKVWAVAANRSVKHLMSKKHVEIHILQQLHS